MEQVKIHSPLTGLPNVTSEGERSVDRIISAYKKLGVNVSHYFTGLENIKVFRCNDTGYGFYFPFSVSGKGEFYEQLQKYDWYYMPWKWEHEVSLKYINDGAEVLEVGCGQGAFLSRLGQLKRVTCTGLEINESAIRTGPSLRIINETIETHAENNVSKYDIACSYQVLEHISGVRTFIQGQLTSLKPGGLLLISVPNNESFMGSDKYAALNMPPHHMGLWDTKSIKALEKQFAISLIAIEYEDLQRYHYDSYIISQLKKNFGVFLTRVIFKFIKLKPIHTAAFAYLEKRKNRIKGHTVFAVYRKN